jgi:hypothetical protein
VFLGFKFCNPTNKKVFFNSTGHSTN